MYKFDLFVIICFTRIPGWAASIYPHHVQRLHAARHASRVTKGGHRHANPQKVWPRSRRRPELSSDIKPDLPIQGHRKNCCLAAERISSGEQIVSRSSVSLQTGTLHRDRSSEDLLRHPGCCWFGSGNAPWTARPERGLQHCWSRHHPNKASSIVQCHRICIGLDRLIHPASKSIGQLPRSNFHTDTAAIWRATRISPWTTPFYPLHLRRDINCHFTRCWSSLVCWRQSTHLHCPPPINRLLPRNWRNASKVLSGGCDQFSWNWIRTRPNSCGLGPGNSWRRLRHSICKLGNIALNSQPSQRIWEWLSIQNWEWTCT